MQQKFVWILKYQNIKFDDVTFNCPDRSIRLELPDFFYCDSSVIPQDQINEVEMPAELPQHGIFVS